MSCGNGALQTRGTCWFYSIINGFLMSSSGQKILFASLEKFYRGLTPEEKAYFDDGIDAPCPLRADIIKTKRIYFYKFLDQYLCYRSGPRSISVKAGKSVNILGGVSLAGSLAKAHMGGQGAFPGEELPNVLKHLGLTDYLVADDYGILPTADARKRPHFVVCKAKGRRPMPKVPLFRPGSYSKMCCSITIGNSNASNSTLHKFHAITGFVCDGKGYLFDSNQRKNFPCKWWIMTELEDVVNKDVASFYSFFAGGQINYFNYNYVIYNRDDYVRNIHPVCRLKRKAPRGAGNNPSQQAARKQLMATYDAILRNATSKENAIQKFRNLTSAGYAVSWPDFERKLQDRFSRPTLSFNNVKREMSSKKLKYERQAIYSRVYKNFQSNQRKILAHYRDTGVWINSVLKKKPVAPSPKAPPLRENINKLKTAKARAAWLKAKKNILKLEEIKNLKNYIKTKNQANRNRRAAKKKAA